MVSVFTLWLPILVATVSVFIASPIIHMVLPWHRGDYKSLPDEEAYRAAVGPMAIPPGDYMVPRPPTRDAMKSPEFQRKWSEGPVAIMTVMANRKVGMGAQMGLWFLYILIVSWLVGLLASHTIAAGATLHQRIHVIGLTAWLAYSAAYWPQKIWFRRALRMTLAATLDGFIYAGLTALTFAHFWPQ